MALQNFCNCQLGVSQNNNKPVKILTQLVVEIAREKWRKINTSCVLSDAWIWYISLGLKISSNILVRIFLFLKNYVTSEEAVYHNYQHLFIARYQVRFMQTVLSNC